MDILKAVRRVWVDRATEANELATKHTHEISDGMWRISMKGDRERWQELARVHGVPDHASQKVEGDTLTIEWPSISDAVFASGGILDQSLDNYEMRQAQLNASRVWERAIEMRETATIEAGTGTGKSFIGLATPLMQGKRVVVSTSNKALQAQLMNKDLPFLFKTLPGCQNKRAVIVQGRGNYICRNKVEGDGGMPIADPELAAWYRSEKEAIYTDQEFTDRGNLENYGQIIELEEKDAVTTDNCLRNKCPYYETCFYYRSKEQRADADVIVCNHALLVLNFLYPFAGILPEFNVTVVDEAHKLADYVRNAISYEFDLERIDSVLENQSEFFKDAQESAAQFREEIERYARENTIDREIPVKKDGIFESGQALALLITQMADYIWDNEDMPSTSYEVTLQNKANRVRKFASNLALFSGECPDKHVRWIGRSGKGLSCVISPYDVSDIIRAMVEQRVIPEHEDAPLEDEKPDYTRCTRCHRTLTAESVYVLNGQPFGPVCIGKVDLLDDAEQMLLTDWLAMTHEDGGKSSHEGAGKATLFMSATLAAPIRPAGSNKWSKRVVRNMSLFMKDTGLDDSMQIISASPFDYKENSLIYVPDRDFPQPNALEWPEKAIDEIDFLVNQSKGGALLLFTSYKMLNAAYDALAIDFELADYPCWKQGLMSKMETIREFKESGRGVIFATGSFFEGVDIPGNALRLVVLDKMPYSPPNPLENARNEDIRRALRGKMDENELKWYPYWNRTVPLACQTLQQGYGRLIRTANDTGVFALLDSRARKPMTYPFIASVLPGIWTDKHYAIDNFYRRRTPRIAEMTPVEQLEQLADTLPF